MQEVLGVSQVAGISQSIEEAPQQPALIILTPRLQADEASLLNKILSSIRLPDYVHHEAEIFDGIEAAHVVVFDGGSGTREEGGVKWWHLPELKDMLGSSVQVTALKRTTWTLLQQLSHELQ